MKRYIALLRGINVSGKNKIAMSELKEGFTGLGYAEVLTHLNSGNVIFFHEGNRRKHSYGKNPCNDTGAI